MPRFMIRASYSPETWAALIVNPEDRSKAVGKLIETIGGRLEALYFAFGDDDIVAIFEAPDNLSAGALGVAVSSSGSFSSYKTTVLLTTAEAMEVMKKAGAISYRRPGSS